ncbi:MAG: Ada metal-binding domain-containing protein [bacterium]|nr:Ada metal-binding domain-containing protein [bacterium]
MTIADGTQRGKALLGRIPPDILVVLVLILSATLAFGLGVLAGKDMVKAEGKDGFWIEQLPEKPLPSAGGPAAAIEAVKVAKPAIPVATSGTYLASKNGTKYYLPTCGSAKRIKPENIVWFQTKAEAEAAGYGPAANCPGL